MKKFLLTLIVLLISAVPKLSAKEIVLERWRTGWTPALPTSYNSTKESTHTKDGLTLTVFNCSASTSTNADKLQFAKNAGYIKITNIDGIVTSIDFYSFTQASTAAGVELKEISGDNESSIGTVILSKADFTTKFSISIPSEKQGTGKIYKIANNTTKATQISKIVINIADNGPIDAPVTAAPISVVKGGTANIVLSGVPEVADLGELSYSVAAGSESYVNVSTDGVVTGLAETAEPATVNIAWAGSEKYNAGQTTCAVTVTDPNHIGSITFDPASGTELTIGQKVTITCPGATNITWMGGDNIMGEVDADRAEVAITEACTLEVVATNAAGTSTEAQATYTIKAADAYSLVKSAADIVDGAKYLIVYKAETSYEAMANSVETKTMGHVSIPAQGDKLLVSDEAAIIFTLEKSGNTFKLKANDTNYLLGGSSSLKLDNTGSDWSISIGEQDYKAEISTTVSQTKYIISYNTALTNVGFRAYKVYQNQGYTYLYRLDEDRDPIDAPVVIEPVTVFVGKTSKISIGGIDNISDLGTITYTLGEEAEGNLTVDSEGNISGINPVEVALVNISWTGSKIYNPGSAEVYVEVKSNDWIGTVTFDPEDGEVFRNTPVTISCENAKTITYVINDGEEITVDAPATIIISEDCEIMAYGTNEFGTESELNEAIYIVKSFQAKDVISRDVIATASSYKEITYNSSCGAQFKIYANSRSGYDTDFGMRPTTDKTGGGFVTTISKGYIRKLNIVLGDDVAENRSLIVYGSNSPYTSSILAQDSNFDGTVITTFDNVKYTPTLSLDIVDNYKYIAIQPVGGVVFFKSISVDWTDVLSNKHAVLSMVEVGDPNGWDHISNSSDLLVNTTENAISFRVEAEAGYTVHHCIHREGDAIVPEQPTEPEQPGQPASVMRRAEHADDAAHTWIAVGDDNLITIPTGSGTLYLTTHNGVEYAEPTAITYNIGANVQTGVENVNVTTGDTEEWYTLDGIRVAEPAAGRVYIRRTSAGATRVMVR